MNGARFARRCTSCSFQGLAKQVVGLVGFDTRLNLRPVQWTFACLLRALLTVVRNAFDVLRLALEELNESRLRIHVLHAQLLLVAETLVFAVHTFEFVGTSLRTNERESEVENRGELQETRSE